MFAAGVLNAFGRADYDPFDMYIGVSAGACHLASHLAGQFDRNFDITLKYSVTSDFINPWRFLRGGHLMDLDWMWEQTIHNCRLDLAYLFNKLRTQMKEYIIVATSMETGKALYLDPDETTLENDLKVSSAMPVFFRRTLEACDQKATDGGIADSIPVREACRRGATEITIIRSRPMGYIKKHSHLTAAVFSLYFRKYPQLVEMFKKRAENYNAAVKFINNPPDGVKMIQIVPPDNITIGRTTKKEKPLRTVYETGIAHGEKYIKNFNL